MIAILHHKLLRLYTCRCKCIGFHRFTICLAVIVLVIPTAISCHTQKNAAYCSEQSLQTTDLYSQLQMLHSFDSLLQYMEFFADSVTIRFAAPVPKSGKTTETNTPAVLQITAHQPRLNTTTQKQSSVMQYSQEQDSTHQHWDGSQNSYTNKETVGIAQPANLNWIIPFVLMLILGAVFLLLWLHKRKIV